ncbi:Sensor histidine kinase GraS [Clostridioides difficile]|uniref:HAMP domain-containing histidine kinase n=1 Tax=unclassified Clostridioides TaxID=2635829 RepID=UPI0006BBF694|nr:histidine kinase [Clostridioides difficile]MDI0265360.1 HAMP domain-containing histidine kinase [Clostridioides difficile]MDI7814801.1 HAMP domain-containing histidine kinase [Clostridioides difficile]NJI81740.1 HAMP domain-containing histidine kinase [Clostridioides difficile]NJJ36870.1 HAMP domain-containing histidine kinase [Clostridioides difficile]
MSFKDFLKDKLGFLIYNFTFLIFTIAVILFSPVEIFLTDTILYILIINVVFLLLYLLISYIKKNKFLNNIKNDIAQINSHDIELIKCKNEEKIYLNTIKNYQYKCNKIINNNVKKFEENKEIMSMWVHDIKMPIAIIKLTLEQNEDLIDEKISNDIDNEIFRIENSVEKILYLSKLEDFHKDFLIQEVNIEKIIRDIIRKYSKYFISKKIILGLNNLNFKVLSDEKWLYFIFEQLLSNSLKYSSLGDNISIYCKTTKNYLQLRVEDTGCGIKKEDLNRIFNKGFTGNNGRNNAKSTGLGLYLAKELCDKLGHKIDVDSEYNQYTKFTITFKCDL